MHERKSVIVHFRHKKVLKKLNTFGHVSYFHNKRRYAVVYIDAENAEQTIEAISKLRHVKKAELSPLYEETQDETEDVK